jgi:enterochelin esterase-like enzyme
MYDLGVFGAAWPRNAVAPIALAAAIALYFQVGRSTAELTPAPAPIAAIPSAGRVLQETFWSAALNRSMPYNIYLPPGYDEDVYSRYPVVYLLHGLGGNQDSWLDHGIVQQANDLIAAREIPPLIIVAPAGDRGYWVDHANGGPRYGSYISRDLISFIDKEYRTFAHRDFRAIGGISMGGHGALQLALNNPSTFGVVGAHSVALRRKEQAFDFFGDRQYFEAHDPVTLCQKDQGQARQLLIWLDIGANDHWYGAAKSFHELLVAQRIPHSWQVYDGGHDPSYWRRQLPDYLRFYGQAFVSLSARPGA